MFAIIAALFHPHVPDTAVRATLGDGQILMGEVRTKTLRLQGGEGLLEIPLADVGEVVPAEGGELGDAHGFVDVWLRNGSELKGKWADPQLDLAILVGGQSVGVQLPMDDLTRFQLQGSERWPQGEVYRMRTTYGDDFLVDPARTHLALDNNLGKFEPLLSECRSVAPVGDPTGEWRVELQTGTVLVGHMRDDVVTVALPMGPDTVSVPLAHFVSLHVENWGQPLMPVMPVVPQYQPDGRDYIEEPSRKPVDDGSVSDGERGVTQPVEAPESVSQRATPARAAPAAAGWFDSKALQGMKKAKQ